MDGPPGMARSSEWWAGEVRRIDRSSEWMDRCSANGFGVFPGRRRPGWESSCCLGQTSRAYFLNAIFQSDVEVRGAGSENSHRDGDLTVTGHGRMQRQPPTRRTRRAAASHLQHQSRTGSARRLEQELPLL